MDRITLFARQNLKHILVSIFIILFIVTMVVRKEKFSVYGDYPGVYSRSLLDYIKGPISDQTLLVTSVPAPVPVVPEIPVNEPTVTKVEGFNL